MVAEALILVVAAYLALGGVVGGVILVWVERLDETARGASMGTKLLWWPGLCWAWPVVLGRWARARRSGDGERVR